VLEAFADLGDEYYPGSRERRQTVPAPRPPGVEADPLGPGEVMVLRGREVEFYRIGQVARAINRKSSTLRMWELKGILPPSGYQTASADPRGVRRLYTRAQAEGIIRLAKSTGIMDASSRPPLHAFKDMVWELFNELKGAAR
jgi:hypothetical protein